MIEYVIAAVVGLAIGALLARMLWSGTDETEVQRLRDEGDAAVEKARREAEESVRRELESLTSDAEKATEERRAALKKREDGLKKREESTEKRESQLGRRESKLSRRDKDLSRREGKLDRQEAELQQTVEDARRQMESAASLSPEEARALLLDELRDEARRKSIDDIRAIEKEAKAVADERARMVVSAAIQRYASEHVGDRTVTAVNLPSEAMKGRIIGREGRNIRAFEASTGCDVVIDESPETVLVSSFNPVRREVARISMEKLLQDGRIHPARIEEVVARTRKEMNQIVRKRGEAAALELEITGLHPEIIKLLGRLHFTTSFAQNVLRHSIEVGFLAGVMASELGLNPKQAKRAGLLHDLGRAIEQEVEGSHAEVGAAFCRKHGESKAIVHAVAAHHGEPAAKSILAELVAAANTLSANRPGARRDSLAGFINRLENLEQLAMDFDGVETCYALQSGQEVRVMVDNAKLSDRESDLLARDIARRIEQEVSYDGEVRVTVIRATRAVQYAR